MTDERLKEIGDMLRRSPRKGDTVTDEYGNSGVIRDEGIVPELYLALIHARGDVAKWMKLASPEVTQQIIDLVNEIHRLKHKIVKLNDTIYELKESMRSPTSDEESSSGDTED